MIAIIIYFLLVVLVITSKIFILVTEQAPFSMPLLVIDVILTLTMFIAGILYWAKHRPADEKKKADSGNKPMIVLLIIVGISMFINLNKTSMDWDSISLFDARAKYFLNGVKFSEMGNYTKYDIPENRPYYLLYPPFTSFTHIVWKLSKSNIPVSVIYSGYLFALLYVLFSYSRGRFSGFLTALLIIVVGFNRDIFTISTLEYSNLPFTLYIIAGLLLLIKGLEEKSIWSMIMSGLLISSSVWIRQLEPVWMLISLSLLICGFISKRKDAIFCSLYIAAISALSYLSWKSFVSGYSDTPTLIRYGINEFVRPIKGVSTGELITVVIYTIKTWGLYMLAYLIAITLGIMKIKRVARYPDLSILLLFLTLTILFYFVGLYFMSFQKESWMILGNSLIRSSTFLVPIAAIYLFSSSKITR